MDLKKVKFIIDQSSKELNDYLIGLTPNVSEYYNSHSDELIDAKYNYINKHSMIPMICPFMDEVRSTNKTNIIINIVDKIMKYMRSFN